MYFSYVAIHSPRFPTTHLLLGIVLGLMLLARVNSLVGVLVFVIITFALSRGTCKMAACAVWRFRLWIRPSRGSVVFCTCPMRLER